MDDDGDESPLDRLRFERTDDASNAAGDRHQGYNGRDDDPGDDRRARPTGHGRGDVDHLTITDQDAAFIIGRGGTTKKKLMRATGAMIDLDNSGGDVRVRGTEAQRKRAMSYLKYVIQQRVGPVLVDLSEERDDLTGMVLPKSCVGYITGRAGNTLRKMEEEYGTLMFLTKNHELPHDTEQLVIAGDLKARRATELRVMSSLEQKIPGHCVRPPPGGGTPALLLAPRCKADGEPPGSVRRGHCAAPRRARAKGLPTPPSFATAAELERGHNGTLGYGLFVFTGAARERPAQNRGGGRLCAGVRGDPCLLRRQPRGARALPRVPEARARFAARPADARCP